MENRVKTRNRPKTYPVTRADGKIVHVTVPETSDDDLFDAVRDQFSPEAIAAMVAFLRLTQTNNSEVNRQIHWFADELVERVGPEEINRLSANLGL